MIRQCDNSEFRIIHEIINDAAQAYKGVIPVDCWKEPYMSKDELRREIDEGVIFWGYEEDGELVGVTGIQHVQDVTLIRHAYVRTAKRNRGIGGRLLSHLRKQTTRPILIGTWADAIWAIRFYEKHGFRLVFPQEKERLLRKYWSVPERQIQTSVVLADQKSFDQICKLCGQLFMMESILRRPFYTEFAWAYDLIIEGPISSRCDFVEDVLSQRGVLFGSKILDAGCGTGSYSIELARRGYIVTGLDISTELISEAKKKSGDNPLPLTFEVGDVLKLSSAPKFDGILCRGVLNDMTDDISRQGAFFSFARALRKGGVLILDVREWNSTALRKAKEPTFEKSVETDRGKLTFRSVTQLDDKTRQLIVSERHTVTKDGVETVSEYDFIMRCWTKEELHNNLVKAGFGSIVYFGDYDRNIPIGSTDRMVAVASLKR